MKTAFCMLAIVLFIETSFAEIIHVPADFPTVNEAIASASEGDTVLLAPGTHRNHVMISGMNLVIASEFLLTGNPFAITGTVLTLPVNVVSQVISFNDCDSTTQLVGLTISGGRDYSGGGIACHNSSLIIRDNIIADNIGDAGGGIFCENSSPKILRNTIRDNTMYSPISNPGGGICMSTGSSGEIAYNVIVWNENQDGAGIACVNSSPWIHHNIIAQNQAMDLGGAMRCDNSSPLIEYNVFANNEAGTGGGFAILLSSSPIIRNCIIWENEGAQIHASGATPTVSFSNIQGGWIGEGNIDSSPRFRNASALDYRLRQVECGFFDSSPCIDAGDPAEYDSIDLCNWGLGESRADMGAYAGLGDSVASFVDSPPLVESHLLCSAYPNPFNATTTIEFSLSFSSAVELSVYNTLGEIVFGENLGNFDAGIHSQSFNGQNLASGLYIVRMSANTFVATTKLLLLK